MEGGVDELRQLVSSCVHCRFPTSSRRVSTLTCVLVFSSARANREDQRILQVLDSRRRGGRAITTPAKLACESRDIAPGDSLSPVPIWL